MKNLIQSITTIFFFLLISSTLLLAQSPGILLTSAEGSVNRITGIKTELKYYETSVQTNTDPVLGNHLNSHIVSLVRLKDITKPDHEKQMETERWMTNLDDKLWVALSEEEIILENWMLSPGLWQLNDQTERSGDQ
ncbi:MAG: hypothetical protein JW894_01840 [Bacteroidales bacterium]|nr:hypothetical protein [Bacteroidales bacterium]